jgi:hypothetical protein
MARTTTMMEDMKATMRAPKDVLFYEYRDQEEKRR